MKISDNLQLKKNPYRVFARHITDNAWHLVSVCRTELGMEKKVNFYSALGDDILVEVGDEEKFSVRYYVRGTHLGRHI